MKISEIEPQIVFQYFEEICSIPHGSGNTGMITQYCIDFADKHGLKYYTDETGNVVIYKNGTDGYKNSKPVILQGHLDMVCDKTDDCDIDMAKEPIRVLCDGEFITADGTTLGGDDGIAIAYILAILASNDIPHPPIEALLTADEEIGMIGVNHLDASCLKGKRLINIDSEKEGILIISCAGGVRAFCELPMRYIASDLQTDRFYTLSIHGLRGGHSGMDINKRRKNAIKVMGRLLEYISRRCQIHVSSINGGGKDNAIPKSCSAVVATNVYSVDLLNEAVADFTRILKTEVISLEPDISITIDKCQPCDYYTDADSTRKLIFALMQIADGIQAMSPDIPDMVQTSMNLGTAYTDERGLILKYLVRSNAAAGKQKSIENLVSFIEYLDGKVEFTSDYPAWEYRMNSPLRDVMVSAYKDCYADVPLVQSIHAGLECGILSSKIPDADIISFGPDIEFVHTPEERLNIESVRRSWYYLLEVLKQLK